MKKNIKKIMLSSVFEAVGITVLSSTYAFWKGTVYTWWYHPIEIAILFLGLSLCKIGFSIYCNK